MKQRMSGMYMCVHVHGQFIELLEWEYRWVHRISFGVKVTMSYEVIIPSHLVIEQDETTTAANVEHSPTCFSSMCDSLGLIKKSE